MTKQIHLGPKKSTLFALVDDEDYDRVMSMGKWHARKKKRTNYAEKTVENTSIRMHRVVLGVPPAGMCVDHIDGDGLNNQKNNLRFVTFSQNSNHRTRKQEGCSSKYRGVFRNTQRHEEKRWTSRIKVGAKRHTLGYFPTEEEAAMAYDVAGIRMLGEFFKPNFPDRIPVAGELERPSGAEPFVSEPRSMAEGKLQEGYSMTAGLDVWSFR